MTFILFLICLFLWGVDWFLAKAIEVMGEEFDERLKKLERNQT